ncbi:restriction endonuclease [Rhodopila sp.]|uniref:restriction endonuclease n=1 Tax=Rhodopila sp. TaxID=2480087 RepID=UPI003D0D9656
MLPVLRHSAEKTWTMRDLINRIADDLKLDKDERVRPIPSGGTTIIASRVHWAKTYLKQAGLIEQPRRGAVQITEVGRDVLNTNPAKLDNSVLLRYDSFRSFLGKTKADDGVIVIPDGASAPVSQFSATPEEQLETASGTLDASLRDALLTRIVEASPSFFERTIVDLLLAMGYGGSRADAGEQLGGTGDGGIDGVIREDQLGLDQVYLQAKRYKPGNTVGAETVQAFIGALVGRGASKGVLITTSSFSKAALTAARQLGSLRLVLIDGDLLTNLMIRFKVGVRVARTIEIKRVDLAYFQEDEAE